MGETHKLHERTTKEKAEGSPASHKGQPKDEA
jgi:hypothetical protein